MRFADCTFKAVGMECLYLARSLQGWKNNSRRADKFSSLACCTKLATRNQVARWSECFQSNCCPKVILGNQTSAASPTCCLGKFGGGDWPRANVGHKSTAHARIAVLRCHKLFDRFKHILRLSFSKTQRERSGSWPIGEKHQPF